MKNRSTTCNKLVNRFISPRRQIYRAALHLADIPGMGEVAKQLDASIRRVEALFVKAMRDAMKEAGWWADVRRCQAVEGIGPLTAMALSNTFHRGHFNSSDAFIAFMGMDVRIRDSGTKRGQRRLTKKGDPELRRLLYVAAMAGRKSDRWSSLYDSYLEQGMKRIPALIKLGRKIARIAFALMKNQSTYRPKNA